MSDDDHVLTTSELICGYDDALLGPLDLEIPGGVFLLVEGPNGIGKTTLLKTLVELVDPLDGDFDWDPPAEQLRFVPQVRTLDPILPATVADVVATGEQQGSDWLQWGGGVDESAVRRRLEKVEMEEFTDVLFRDLSEGQKQLVLLARALIGESSVLLLDEPTASMDPDREVRAVSLLREVRDREGTTVFAVAHGSSAMAEAATHRLEIDQEREVALVES